MSRSYTSFPPSVSMGVVGQLYFYFCAHSGSCAGERAWPRRQSGESRIVSKQNASPVEALRHCTATGVLQIGAE
jgi:hypothetical protein